MVCCVCEVWREWCGERGVEGVVRMEWVPLENDLWVPLENDLL